MGFQSSIQRLIPKDYQSFYDKYFLFLIFGLWIFININFTIFIIIGRRSEKEKIKTGPIEQLQLLTNMERKKQKSKVISSKDRDGNSVLEPMYSYSGANGVYPSPSEHFQEDNNEKNDEKQGKELEKIEIDHVIKYYKRFKDI